MPLSAKEIKEILEILEDSGWDEAQVTVDDVTLTVSKRGGELPSLGGLPGPAPIAGNGAAVQAPGSAPDPPAAGSQSALGVPVALDPSAASASSPVPLPAALAGHVVEAPSVGVFWRAPEPGAAPFVEVNDAVEAGDTICICEVMKLFQHVVTDVAGVVAEIHVANGDHVEYGQPLVTIRPNP